MQSSLWPSILNGGSHIEAKLMDAIAKQATHSPGETDAPISTEPTFIDQPTQWLLFNCWKVSVAASDGDGGATDDLSELELVLGLLRSNFPEGHKSSRANSALPTSIVNFNIKSVDGEDSSALQQMIERQATRLLLQQAMGVLRTLFPAMTSACFVSPVYNLPSSQPAHVLRKAFNERFSAAVKVSPAGRNTPTSSALLQVAAIGHREVLKQRLVTYVATVIHNYLSSFTASPLPIYSPQISLSIPSTGVAATSAAPAPQAASNSPSASEVADDSAALTHLSALYALCDTLSDQLAENARHTLLYAPKDPQVQLHTGQRCMVRVQQSSVATVKRRQPQSTAQREGRTGYSSTDSSTSDSDSGGDDGGNGFLWVDVIGRWSDADLVRSHFRRERLLQREKEANKKAAALAAAEEERAILAEADVLGFDDADAPLSVTPSGSRAQSLAVVGGSEAAAAGFRLPTNLPRSPDNKTTATHALLQAQCKNTAPLTAATAADQLREALGGNSSPLRMEPLPELLRIIQEALHMSTPLGVLVRSSAVESQNRKDEASANFAGRSYDLVEGSTEAEANAAYLREWQKRQKNRQALKAERLRQKRQRESRRLKKEAKAAKSAPNLLLVGQDEAPDLANASRMNVKSINDFDIVEEEDDIPPPTTVEEVSLDYFATVGIVGKGLGQQQQKGGASTNKAPPFTTKVIKSIDVYRQRSKVAHAARLSVLNSGVGNHRIKHIHGHHNHTSSTGGGGGSAGSNSADHENILILTTPKPLLSDKDRLTLFPPTGSEQDSNNRKENAASMALALDKLIHGGRSINLRTDDIGDAKAKRGKEAQEEERRRKKRAEQQKRKQKELSKREAKQRAIYDSDDDDETTIQSLGVNSRRHQSVRDANARESAATTDIFSTTSSFASTAQPSGFFDDQSKKAVRFSTAVTEGDDGEGEYTASTTVEPTNAFAFGAGQGISSCMFTEEWVCWFDIKRRIAVTVRPSDCYSMALMREKFRSIFGCVAQFDSIDVPNPPPTTLVPHRPPATTTGLPTPMPNDALSYYIATNDRLASACFSRLLWHFAEAATVNYGSYLADLDRLVDECESLIAPSTADKMRDTAKKFMFSSMWHDLKKGYQKMKQEAERTNANNRRKPLGDVPRGRNGGRNEPQNEKNDADGAKSTALNSNTKSSESMRTVESGVLRQGTDAIVGDQQQHNQRHSAPKSRADTNEAHRPNLFANDGQDDEGEDDNLVAEGFTYNDATPVPKSPRFTSSKKDLSTNASSRSTSLAPTVANSSLVSATPSGCCGGSNKTSFTQTKSRRGEGAHPEDDDLGEVLLTASMNEKIKEMEKSAIGKVQEAVPPPQSSSNQHQRHHCEEQPAARRSSSCLACLSSICTTIYLIFWAIQYAIRHMYRSLGRKLTRTRRLPMDVMLSTMRLLNIIHHQAGVYERALHEVGKYNFASLKKMHLRSDTAQLTWVSSVVGEEPPHDAVLRAGSTVSSTIDPILIAALSDSIAFFRHNIHIEARGLKFRLEANRAQKKRKGLAAPSATPSNPKGVAEVQSERLQRFQRATATVGGHIGGAGVTYKAPQSLLMKAASKKHGHSSFAEGHSHDHARHQVHGDTPCEDDDMFGDACFDATYTSLTFAPAKAITALVRAELRPSNPITASARTSADSLNRRQLLTLNGIELDTLSLIFQYTERLRHNRHLTGELVTVSEGLQACFYETTLTIVAVIDAIFMPANFITGSFGTNFVNEPPLLWVDGYFIFVGLALLSVGVSLCILLWMRVIRLW